MFRNEQLQRFKVRGTHILQWSSKWSHHDHVASDCYFWKALPWINVCLGWELVESNALCYACKPNSFSSVFSIPRNIVADFLLPHHVEFTKPILNHQDYMANRKQKRCYLYRLKNNYKWWTNKIMYSMKCIARNQTRSMFVL